MPAQVITADFGPRSYNLYYGSGLFGLLCEVLEDAKIGPNILVVTNRAVKNLYGERLVQSVGARRVRWAVIPAGERHKNLQTVARLYTSCARAKIDRQSAIIGLGGGVVQDIANFVAATFRRGVPFIQIPTTLLAQVDIGIGGCAVDHPLGKSLVGTFYQPRAVITDLDCLETLPTAEFVNGIAEIINKVAGLGGRLEQLNKDMPNILARDKTTLLEYIIESNRIKIAIIQKDETGVSGERLALDWGHTLTYALEKVTGYRMAHGTALGIGMTAAVMLSASLGYLPRQKAELLKQTVQLAGLPTSIPQKIDLGSLLAAMRLDSKAKEGKIRFVLFKEFGKPFLCDPIPERKIKDLLTELKAPTPKQRGKRART